MDIFYLGKKTIKDKFYLNIYFCGAVKLVPISKQDFDECNLDVGDRLNSDYFEISCFNKGYDTILNLKVK